MLGEAFDRDARSVRGVLTGRPDQFEGLVRRYLPAVRAVALAHTRNAADADDVAQEAFIAAYRSLDRLREPSQFRGWLMTIARNTARSYLRGERRESAARERVEMDEAVAPADLVSEELRAALHGQLDALDADTRELLLLHYFSGYNAREIGAMLNLSHGAVRKRLQRGREALGARLLAALGESPGRRSDERTVKAITAAAIGAGAAWTATASSATVVMGAKVWGGLAVVGGCAALAAAALLWPAPEAPVQNAMTVVETADALDAGLEMEDEATDTGASAFEIAGRVEPAEAPAASAPVVEAAMTFTDLTGLWELYLTESVESAEPTLIAEILDAGGALRMFSRSKESPLGMFRGTVSEDAVRLTSYPGDPWRPMSNAAPDPAQAEAYLREFADGSPNRRERAAEMVGRMLYDVEGLRTSVDALRFEADVRIRESANLAWSVAQHLRDNGASARFEGTVTDDYLRIAGALLLPGEAEEQRIPAILVRMDASAVEALASMAVIEDDLAAFETALEAYMERHEGRTPASLAELFADSPDLEAGWTHLSRRTVSLHRVEPAGSGDAVRFDETFAPGLPPADRYLAWEEYLKAAWGSGWPHGATVATVRLPEIGRTARLRSQFGRVDWSIEETAAVETLGEPSEEEAAALLASCQNNMKQLGLVIKMYAGENPHTMVPPGWRTVYPEYLTDPNVLVCPCTPNGGVAYTLLFPAFAEPILEELAAQVTGTRLQSVVPVAVESASNHHGGARRNVLFLDGHVEFLTEEGYAQAVEPFLPYAVPMP